MRWTTAPSGLPFLEHLTYPQIMAGATFLIFAAKNIINIVQLWKASKILVGVDLAERAAARAAEAKKFDSGEKQTNHSS